MYNRNCFVFQSVAIMANGITSMTSCSNYDKNVFDVQFLNYVEPGSTYTYYHGN